MQHDEQETRGDHGPRGRRGPLGGDEFQWAEGGPQIPWPEMKRRMREAFREGFRPGDPEWRRFFRQFWDGDRPEGESNRRSNVLSLRVDDRTLAAIDSLVEAGLFATRAESATWLLQAGVASNTELFDRINATVSEIRRLREDLQRQMNAATGAPQPESPDGEQQGHGDQHDHHEGDHQEQHF